MVIKVYIVQYMEIRVKGCSCVEYVHMITKVKSF